LAEQLLLERADLVVELADLARLFILHGFHLVWQSHTEKVSKHLDTVQNERINTMIDAH
jgi:hypothetical protein